MKKLLASALIFTGLIVCGCGGSDDSDGPATPTPSGNTPAKPLTPVIEMPGVQDLLDTTWILTNVHDSSEQWILSDDVRIELQFSVDGNNNRAYGFSGCNSYNGDFGIDHNAIYVANLSSTKKACPARQMEQENYYISALNEAHSFHFEEDRASLVIMYGMISPSSMIFEVAPPPSPAPTQRPKPTQEVTPTPIEPPTPQIRPGTVMVSVYLDMHSSGTQPAACVFPVSIGFYAPNSDSSMLVEPNSAMFYFHGTSTCVPTDSGTRAMITVGPVNPGTYDITADSPTSLMNVHRNVPIKNAEN